VKPGGKVTLGTRMADRLMQFKAVKKVGWRSDSQLLRPWVVLTLVAL
jgi:hypothetical protein